MVSTRAASSASLALLAVLALLSDAESADEPLPFGTLVDSAGTSVSVHWQSADGMSFEDGRLQTSAEAGTKALFRTGSLFLKPLTMYSVSVTTRRGPGTKAHFTLRFKDEGGADQRRGLALQLSDTPRASHLALTPYRQTYIQNVCLPDGAKECFLEVSVEGHRDAGLDYLDLFDLTIREVEAIPFSEKRGGNLLSAGAMEIPGPEGVPVGWGTWGYEHPPLKLSGDVSKQGDTCLHISAGVRFYLPSAVAVPVEVGRAYELSFWARGKGNIQFLAHALASSPWYPIPLRVGDPQSSNAKVDSVEWTRFTQVWFAESPHVETAEVVFVIAPEEDVCLDEVQFRLIEPD